MSSDSSFDAQVFNEFDDLFRPSLKFQTVFLPIPSFPMHPSLLKDLLRPQLSFHHPKHLSLQQHLGCRSPSANLTLRLRIRTVCQIEHVGFALSRESTLEGIP